MLGEGVKPASRFFSGKQTAEITLRFRQAFTNRRVRDGEPGLLFIEHASLKGNSVYSEKSVCSHVAASAVPEQLRLESLQPFAARG